MYGGRSRKMSQKDTRSAASTQLRRVGRQAQVEGSADGDDTHQLFALVGLGSTNNDTISDTDQTQMQGDLSLDSAVAAASGLREWRHSDVPQQHGPQGQPKL
jgi:hypothetical protein